MSAPRRPAVPEAAAAVRFGRSMRAAWALDPGIIYLNHGTVGAPPRRVLAAQQAIRDEIERQPARYLLRELADMGLGAVPSGRPRMRLAADAVAPFLGARGDDLVFVDNATAGINAVLRSFDLRPDDEILITDLAYGSVPLVAASVARERRARVRVAGMPYPVRSPEDVVEAVAAAIGPRTRIAIIEHVTSESALILPLAAIAARCRERGVAVLADGAHAPGAMHVDLPALGVDWYAGTLHKWACAPRSCGILWAAPERQPGLHPPVVSWGYGAGFAAEFDWVGTRDPSPYLAAPEGIAFLRDLGIAEVWAYNHGLAWDGAKHLSERWGTTLGMGESMVGCMATIPLPERMGSTKEEARQLRDSILLADTIEIQMHAWRGRLWVRLSAQVYNERADIERLADAVAARL